ncbi:MAG: flavodoxin family protein [Lentisphaeria bacterium]|nr:flavodoxin family protein [Lentisphaeria bacterium]
MATVLGFNGSPRVGGNTDRLVQRVLAGAEAAGAQTRLIQLSTLDFGSCTACMSCRCRPACALEDEMSGIVQEIFAADAVVIGSPIYMWQVTGLTKLFMDRLYPVLGPDFKTRLSRKPKLVLAFTQGHPDAAFFRPYFEQVRSVLGFLGFTVTEVLTVTGTRAPEDIEKQADILARADAAGKALA